MIEANLIGKEKEKLKKKLGYICVYCGCTNKLMLEIDHKIPKVRGGLDIIENKQVTCVICNRLKGGLTDEEFRKYYKSLQSLKDLCKVNIKPFEVIPIFSSHKHPDFGCVNLEKNDE